MPASYADQFVLCPPSRGAPAATHAVGHPPNRLQPCCAALQGQPLRPSILKRLLEVAAASPHLTAVLASGGYLETILREAMDVRALWLVLVLGGCCGSLTAKRLLGTRSLPCGFQGLLGGMIMLVPG